mmetsp:Transcript_17849/g.31537  ORF Transcript_17849/g.31537 Transcript_17849/m.31537 type:complete len:221 (+) Transcript_17849:255-917(+)
MPLSMRFSTSTLATPTAFSPFALPPFSQTKSASSLLFVNAFSAITNLSLSSRDPNFFTIALAKAPSSIDSARISSSWSTFPRPTLFVISSLIFLTSCAQSNSASRASAYFPNFSARDGTFLSAFKRCTFALVAILLMVTSKLSSASSVSSNRTRSSIKSASISSSFLAPVSSKALICSTSPSMNFVTSSNSDIELSLSWFPSSICLVVASRKAFSWFRIF